MCVRCLHGRVEACNAPWQARARGRASMVAMVAMATMVHIMTMMATMAMDRRDGGDGRENVRCEPSGNGRAIGRMTGAASF